MIQIKNLSVDLGGPLLRDITLDIQRGEYFVILGPTGAGKTVLLEAIAGLHPIKSGQIWMEGRDITLVEPERRRIGFAYQDFVLFPHLSVRDNIAFGLRQGWKSKPEAEARIAWLSALLGISHLLGRRPDTLSGGESQKVALARALATEPKVLLLDEPLSALDPQTREATQRELKQLHSRLGLTTLHVTHDFEEAVALGDRMAVIGEGRLTQVGTPEEIFRRPNSEYVARFALTRNIFAGDVEPGEKGHAFFSIGSTKIAVVTDLRGRLHASIRPEDILVSTEPFHSSALNSFQGTVTHIADRGSVVYLTVTVPPDFICLVTRHSFEDMGLREGTRVFITFKASAVHVF
ncbi:MAG TPA: ABC transporter ATP-binding protein [Dehalococcoidia bacterium]|nr:ABC transporter ATP-binding protein [Dehalococcoidia bacterium]